MTRLAASACRTRTPIWSGLAGLLVGLTARRMVGAVRTPGASVPRSTVRGGRGPTADLRLQTVCLDCHDVDAMARFYGGLLGWTPTFTEPDWVLMRDPAGGTGLSFQSEPGYEPPTWPERPGAQQKMLHLDVRVTAGGADLCGPDGETAGQAALEVAVRLAVASGGRLAEPQSRDDLRVLLDPAGHPLCLFLH